MYIKLIRTTRPERSSSSIMSMYKTIWLSKKRKHGKSIRFRLISDFGGCPNLVLKIGPTGRRS
ncbi:uncharacterized protein Bfra_008885 [Botrytis fragariae]|uniref:Uncharacterized protein n=1 Tax=Botrytis fragariae TaxID=1964551 RepID=A0A8H6EHA3_9HELO|nr:uncharacterized protein Bfra_008885 [Botrytis fragariae]KAF5871860.1 hypothetical protein Bfra_008885 [Botrytis fragariae]